MTTIEKLQNQITELQKQLDELKEQSEAQTVGWTPENCEDYYALGADGSISKFTWNNEYYENDSLSQGHIFKTQAEAEKERDRRAVTKKLRDLAGGYQFNVGDRNWLLNYDHQRKTWVINAYWCQFPNNVYFPNQEAAQHAIDVLGDELNKLL